jgi:hypothetical protein
MIARILAQAQTGGRRSFQGRACSSCAASWISKSSRPKAATNCVPIGNPVEFQYSGREIAGCPVTLNWAVNGISSMTRRWT